MSSSMEAAQVREQKILTDARAGHPVRFITSRYGVSSTLVYKVLKDNGVEIPKTGKASQQSISQYHVRLGAFVTSLRAFTKEATLAEFAADIGMSPHRLGSFERGQYDPRLSELERISKHCDIKLQDLVAGGPLASAIRSQH